MWISDRFTAYDLKNGIHFNQGIKKRAATFATAPLYVITKELNDTLIHHGISDF